MLPPITRPIYAASHNSSFVQYTMDELWEAARDEKIGGGGFGSFPLIFWRIIMQV